MPGTICLFGDSIAKGVVYSSELSRYTTSKSSFASILMAASQAFSISNFSMFGCTILKGKSLILRHMNDVENCEVAMLEYGGNDSDHNWAEVSLTPDCAHLPKTPLPEFAHNYEEMIDGFQQMGKKMVILNLPPIDEHKYFNWISRGLSAANILKWLGGTDRTIYDFHKGYNDKICEIADAKGVPLIDIRSPFLKMDNYSDCLCEDGIHPNEKGHAIIARKIEESLPEIYLSLADRPGA